MGNFYCIWTFYFCFDVAKILPTSLRTWWKEGWGYKTEISQGHYLRSKTSAENNGLGSDNSFLQRDTLLSNAMLHYSASLQYNECSQVIALKVFY